MDTPGTPILHLVNGEYYAGAERVQDLLALQLPDLGFEVEFACLKDGIFADKRQSKDATLTISLCTPGLILDLPTSCLV